MALIPCLGKGEALLQPFVVAQNASPSPAGRYSPSPGTEILTKPQVGHESFAEKDALPPVQQQRAWQDLLPGDGRGGSER